MTTYLYEPTLKGLTEALDVLMDELGQLRADADPEAASTAEAEQKLRSKIALLVGHTEAKVDAIAARLMMLDRRRESCLSEAERLQARAAKFKKDREWLAGIALEVMERNGWKKLEGVRSTLSRRSGRNRVCIDSFDDLPSRFVKASFVVHVDDFVATEARDAIESVVGEQFNGSVGKLDRVADKMSLAVALSSDEVPGASIEVGPDTLHAYISKARKAAVAGTASDEPEQA